MASGDNEVVFAMAGMGAKVTSVDISEEQLKIAQQRARTLGLEVSFVRSDATDLHMIDDDSFDVVYTGIGAAVWMSDIRRYFCEAVRILRPGGLFIIKDIHPFVPLLSHDVPKRVDYFDRGPFKYVTHEGFTAREHCWTVADHIQAVLDAGCDLVKVDEIGSTVAGDGPGSSYDHVATEGEIGDAGAVKLPTYLLIVGRKR